MNNRSQPLKNRFLYYLPLILISFVIFARAFFSEYGMHNDYRLIPNSFQDPTPFAESDHLYIVGRPLQSILMNWLSWAIIDLKSLALFRFLAYLLMLGFVILFDYFLRRRSGFDKFWSRIILFLTMILPASELYVIWGCHIIPGYVALISALIAYILMDIGFEKWKESSFQNKSLAMVLIIIAALSYLSSLFNYPFNSVFVFVCTFARVFFNSMKDWFKSLKIIFRDGLFFGACMAIYYLANVKYFIPHTPSGVDPNRVEGTAYSFHVSFDIEQKFHLIFKTFAVALGGTIHTLLGKSGIIVNGIIFLVGVSLYVYCYIQKNKPSVISKSTQKRYIIPFILFFISISVMLFALSNIPTLMAKSCFDLVGYRVLFPASVFLIVLLIGLFQQSMFFFSNKKIKRTIKAIAIFIALTNATFAYINIKDAISNYSIELKYIQKKVEKIDFSLYRTILPVFVPPDKGNTLIGRTMHYEFGYMLTTPELIAPLIVDKIQKYKLNLGRDEGRRVYYDENTIILDINEANVEFKNKAYKHAKPYVFMSTSSSAFRPIDIINEFGGLHFNFLEKLNDKILPYWQTTIDPIKAPWFQLEFIDETPNIVGFGFGLYPKIPAKMGLQGSNDGQNWDLLNYRLIVPNPMDPNLGIYQIENPQSYKYYRFYFFSPTGIPSISRIYFVPQIKQ